MSQEPNQKPKIDVYVTKYALTSGIELHKGEESKEFPNMIGYGRGVGQTYIHGKGVNWHLSLDEAIAQAEKMRLKKIANLKKAIKKLEAMTFSNIRDCRVSD